MCCSHAKLALLRGGMPYRQRLSFSNLSPTPITDVEGRIGHNKVSQQVGMLIVMKGVGVLLTEIELYATNSHVHDG